jgi:hypothetical protein
VDAGGTEERQQTIDPRQLALELLLPLGYEFLLLSLRLLGLVLLPWLLRPIWVPCGMRGLLRFPLLMDQEPIAADANRLRPITIDNRNVVVRLVPSAPDTVEARTFREAVKLQLPGAPERPLDLSGRFGHGQCPSYLRIRTSRT